MITLLLTTIGFIILIILITSNLQSVFGQIKKPTNTSSNEIRLIGNNTVNVTGNITEASKSDTAAWWQKILSHPLVILLVGAGISGYLFPRFTKQWEAKQKAVEMHVASKQKELEIKNDLVTQINRTATDIIITLRFAGISGQTTLPQSDLNRAYREWEISSAVIESRLSAYFPKTAIGPEWKKFSRVMTNLYNLLGTNDVHERDALLGSFRDYLSFDSSAIIEWKVLANKTSSGSDEYQSNWYKLEEQIIALKDSIALKVLDSDMPVLENIFLR